MTALRRRVAIATAASASIAVIAAGCGTRDDAPTPAAQSSTPSTMITRPSDDSARYRDGAYQAKGSAALS